MPAREVERELVGVDAAAFRKRVIEILEDGLVSAAAERLFRQHTPADASLLSNPYFGNPLVSPTGRINYGAFARNLFPVAPMPPGISFIFDKDIPDACE